MRVYECLMIMLMLCKSSYARLTPKVLHRTFSPGPRSLYQQGSVRQSADRRRQLHRYTVQEQSARSEDNPGGSQAIRGAVLGCSPWIELYTSRADHTTYAIRDPRPLPH